MTRRREEDSLNFHREETDEFESKYQRVLRQAYANNKIIQCPSYNKKMYTSVREYITQILNDNKNQTKMFFFLSKPNCGIQYLVEDLTNYYKGRVYSGLSFLSQESGEVGLDYFHEVIPDFKIPNFNPATRTGIDFVVNLPVGILFNNFKNKKLDERKLEKMRKYFLNYLKFVDDKSQQLLIFYWDDGASDKEKKALEKVLGIDIMNHANVEILYFNQITQKNMSNLWSNLLYELGLRFDKDETAILMSNFEGDLLKMKNFLRMQYSIKKKKIVTKSLTQQENESISNLPTAENNSVRNNVQSQQFNQTSNFQFLNSRNLREKENNKINNINNSNFLAKPFNNFSTTKLTIKKEEEDKSLELFHLIGKILYNKRTDPKTGKVRQMNKREMEAKPKPEFYFNLQELINKIPLENNYLNEYLIENAYDHFKDIKELAKASDAFSYTDQLNKFQYRKNYEYEDRTTSLRNLRTLLNSLACMSFNKSQYEGNSNAGFKCFRKPMYDHTFFNQTKKTNKELYYKAVETNRSLVQLGLKKFVVEIKPIQEILNKQKQKSIQNNFKNNFKNNFYFPRQEIYGKAEDDDKLIGMEIDNELTEEEKLISNNPILQSKEEQSRNEMMMLMKKLPFNTDNTYRKVYTVNQKFTPVDLEREELTLDNLDDHIFELLEDLGEIQNAEDEEEEFVDL